MAKERRERRLKRLQRRKAEAKRAQRLLKIADELGLSRSERGPIEILWRTKQITDAQFWAATRFAVCFEASQYEAMLRAVDQSQSIDNNRRVGNDRALKVRRLGAKYHDAVSFLQELDRDSNFPLHAADLLKVVTFNKIGTVAIDQKLKKRMHATKDRLLSVLQKLADYWEADRLSDEKINDA